METYSFRLVGHMASFKTSTKTSFRWGFEAAILWDVMSKSPPDLMQIKHFSIKNLQTSKAVQEIRVFLRSDVGTTHSMGTINNHLFTTWLNNLVVQFQDWFLIVMLNFDLKSLLGVRVWAVCSTTLHVCHMVRGIQKVRIPVFSRIPQFSSS